VAVLVVLLAIIYRPQPATKDVPASSPTAGPTQVSAKDGMTLLYVPAGEFLMGAASSDTAAGDSEKPQHKVYLDAFWIDQTEVTNAMFKKFVDATGYQTDAEKQGTSFAFDPAANSWSDTQGANWQHPRGPSSNLTGLDNHPVVQVSWNDAKAYCDWAGRRLPTEAEWEKAARGTDQRTYPWGNQAVAGDRLNFADRHLNVVGADKNVDDGYQFTSPVGSYPAGASPHGALDMAGNVWEWVADWHGEDYYANAPDHNPTGPGGPGAGNSRVARGISWGYAASFARVTSRGSGTPDFREDDLGLRCVLRSP
jgi:serine/threonine-protein kinase